MPIQPYPLWDLQFVIYVQHHLGFAVGLFKWISIVLAPPTFFVIAMVLYFLDHKKGVLSLFYLALATFLALALKDIVHHPRPFWASPLVAAAISPTDYGMPSGHALFSVYLLFLALLYRKLWGISLAIIGIFLVCLSRMVLGAHYAEQILAGLFLGTFCLLVAPSFFRLLYSPKWRAQGILLAFFVIFLVLLVVFTALYLQWGMYFQPPTEWQFLASRTTKHPLHSVQFWGILSSFLFSVSLVLSLILEHFGVRIRGVRFREISFSKIVNLGLIFAVHCLLALVLAALCYLSSPPLAMAFLACWVPLFFCYQLPLELSVLGLIEAQAPSQFSASRWSLASRLRFSA